MKEKYLGQPVEKLKVAGGLHTAREIMGQPALWQKTWQKVTDGKNGIQEFLDHALNTEGINVVLTGAGTSAFIGEVAEPLLRQNWTPPVRALATTTLVTHFEQYIETDKPLLLISFARSGNSPESTATVQLAEALCKQKVFHLVITCNPEGTLAKEVEDKHSFLFMMPPEAEDQSLAMTGSFSSMLLAILLMGQLDKIEELGNDVQKLSGLGRSFLDKHTGRIEDMSTLDFKRAVFLGSGSRLGIARESHLKLQELTDGNVICKYDSFLGFRHGPKAVIDDQTLIIYLFSEDSHVLQYEKDLARNISEKEFGMASLGISTKPITDIQADVKMEFGPSKKIQAGSGLLPILSVLPAQVLGFFSSLYYGLQPDTPSASGAISRVVEGVTIYPRAHQHE